MVARFPALVAALLMMHDATIATAQTPPDPIRYTVSFPAPQTHYVEVSAVVPAAGRQDVELMMAVWTPGSYLVREYERHVEAVAATGPAGQPLQVSKSDKNRWRVSAGGAASVTVTYRLYAREMTVRTNFVDADFALLNGAPTFMTLGDGVARPHDVTIVPAAGWARSMTSLDPVAGSSHRYIAPDFDTLVDSPIVVGNPAVHQFAVDGKPHHLVNIGEAGIFDGARAAEDLQLIVQEHRRFWGALPYDRYLFINVLTSVPGQIPGGGIEHKSSTTLMAVPWVTRTRQNYLSWLELASHELFHAWNIKRLRPVELGPFNYDGEVFTRSLWIGEGITDYYGDLLVHRAGLSSESEYLESLANKIEELQTAPGRLVQSVELASFDAWIKYYRPDENTVNAAVSYYTKGAVLGFLLDARVRQATGGARSLDDVMRAAFARYSGSRGYTLQEFRAVAEQVAGVSLESFWAAGVEGTSELDYTGALQWLGLRFRPTDAAPAGRAWLGVNTRNDGGRLVVTQIRRESPAYTSGLNVDDEIVAINNFRVRADQLNARLDQYAPGDMARLLVARREQLRTIDVQFGAEPPRRWRLESDPSATPAGQQQRGRWLRPAG